MESKGAKVSGSKKDKETKATTEEKKELRGQIYRIRNKDGSYECYHHLWRR